MNPAFVVFVGLPASGKSTFVENHPSIKRFVISSDQVRLQFGGVTLNSEGKEGIDQLNDKLVWSTIDAMIANRLKNGVTTILDATNCNVDLIYKKYFKLTQKHNFRFVIIKFDCDIDTALERNSKREDYQIVPEFVIHKMNENLKEFGKPTWAHLILDADQITDFWTDINQVTPDWSSYSRIYVIGDIQGCYDNLDNFLKVADYENSAFVFLGDLTDRGPKNLETVRALSKLKSQLNQRMVVLLGNHDLNSRKYFGGSDVPKEQFASTKKEFEEANLSQKETAVFNKFYSKFEWFYKAIFFGHTFFFTHGGIDRVIDNPSLYSGRQYIKGVGDRSNCNQCNLDFTQDSIQNHNGKAWSFHGHRNPEHHEFLTTPRTYVLESQVEFDGYLSVLEIVPNSKNTNQPFDFIEHKY